MPPDTQLSPISRTVGEDQLVDEMLFSFTHTRAMPWMLPGIAPTHRRVEVALVAIVRFREGKLRHEHIYWDQASSAQASWLAPTIHRCPSAGQSRPGSVALFRLEFLARSNSLASLHNQVPACLHFHDNRGWYRPSVLSGSGR